MSRTSGVNVIVSLIAAARAWSGSPALPTGTELREGLRREVRERPSLMRYYSVADFEADGLTFVPGPAKGSFETGPGRWADQRAARLDRGWLQAAAAEIPDQGFTVACWFRHHGMGGLTDHKGRRAYYSGGIAAVGSGWWNGWRLSITPKSGAASFGIGRGKVGAAAATCRSGVQPDRWHHLAATWDRRHINLYLDGHLRAETAYDGAYTPSHANYPLRIGEVGYGLGTLKLDVAEVAIFGEALPPEMIARLANPSAAQAQAIIACLMRGDRAGPGSVAEREQQARSEYRKILSLDVSENPTVLGNYHAIARLRGAASFRREGKFDDARREAATLAGDEAASLHYRARAMLLGGDTYRDQRQYDAARSAYRKMQEFFTGRHENWRVEALHRLADVEGLKDGEPVINARQRRLARISRPAREFFVAPDGSDADAGTKAKPFATLERSRDAVRRLKETGRLPKGGVVVYLRGGTYSRARPFELSEADSGLSTAPVVYRAFPGEKAVVSGGVEVSGFRPVTAAGVPARLPGEARAHVVALDLRKAGVKDFGSIKPRGFALKPVPAHLELFFNGMPMQLARWPNPVGKVAKDFTTVKDLIGEQVVGFHGKSMDKCDGFVYGDERQGRWRDEPDAWIFGYLIRWYAARCLPVTAVEPEKRIIRMEGPAYHRGVLKNAPYFGINLLCELDTPGEYYLDRANGMLYFWPPSSVDEGRAVVSLLETPLLSTDGASHVVFRGITFEAGRADAVRINRGEGVLLAGCTIRNMGNWGVIVGGSGGGHVAIPDLTQGGRNHGVIGCDIAHTGDGGVSLTGGDIKALTPSGHFVENCHIHHIDRWNRAGYQPGINFDGVGCRASHNLIHDGPHQCVRVRCNDHVFEYNEVHDTPYEAREMGLYYMYGRNRVLGERGNIARYNYFHHVPYTKALAKDFVGGGRVIFHIDHMNGGMTIYGNIFHALECPGTFFSGGRENMIENNVFYRCVSAVSLGDRSFCYEAENKPPRCRIDSYLRGMKHDQPPWSVRYPQVAALLKNENRALPENNLVARNISFRVEQWLRTAPIARERSTIEHNWDGVDPGFIDAEKGNFAIRGDSEVFGAIGFEPIPVERIGLYKDELRASWPVHHEVDTHEHMSIARKPFKDLPKCVAVQHTAPITIDGKLDPAEWDGADIEKATVIDRSPNVGPSPAPKSYAWIRRDDQFLYIGVMNLVNPAKPMLKDENMWWRSDMMEVIIEGHIGVGTQGWWLDEAEHGPLFYLVGDFQGNFDSIQIAGLPREQATKLRRSARYAAAVKDPSCWTAEWRIPFASVCLDPVHTEACCFNIGVGKPGTPVDPSWPQSKLCVAKWAAWASANGPNWEVWNAGRLVLRRFRD